MYRSITSLVLAFSVAWLPVVSHSAESMSNSMIDGACLYMKKNNISAETTVTQESRVNEILDEGINVVTGFFQKKAPLCQINSPAGILVATSEFMDRSVLQTALAIDSIEQAMEVDRTLTSTIRELQRALEGESFDLQLSADRVQSSKEMGSRAKELEAELAARSKKFKGSPELKAHVIEARGALSSARYYHAQTALGLATFRDYISKASDDERKAMVLANSAVGLTSGFVNQAPARFGATVTSVFDTMRVGARINDVLHSDLTRKEKRYVKRQEKESRDQAMTVAARADESTENSFIFAAEGSSSDSADDAAGEVKQGEQVATQKSPAPAHETAKDSAEKNSDPQTGCEGRAGAGNQVAETAKKVGKAIGGLFRNKNEDPCKNEA